MANERPWTTDRIVIVETPVGGKEMSATNLPWRYDAEHGWIVDSKDRIVAFCAAARGAYGLTAAIEDFQFIVDAVNNYKPTLAEERAEEAYLETGKWPGETK